MSSSSTDRKLKWTNRERVMVVASRGCSYRERHLMMDLKALMPHTKSESKVDKKQSLLDMNEICTMRNCNKCLYFENRKRKDLYLWMSVVPGGPSAKFLVKNVHTLQELKMTGNCLKGSRPVLSFDKIFDSQSHWKLLKELLIQIFETPNHHPHSQPFIDHVFNFAVEDGRIWFRNYQIVEETGQVEEIGPRFVLELIKIFDGSFGGPVLYENPEYKPPNLLRRQVRQVASGKYMDRISSKKALRQTRQDNPESFAVDATEDVFDTRPSKPSTSDADPAEDPEGPSTTEAASLRHDIERKRKRKRTKKNKTVGADEAKQAKLNSVGDDGGSDS